MAKPKKPESVVADREIRRAVNAMRDRGLYSEAKRLERNLPAKK